MRFILYATVFLASTLSPTLSAAATLDERLKVCGSLSAEEKQKLIDDMLKVTYLFSEFSKNNVAKCYTILTGKPSAYVDGKGLVFDESEIEQAAADKKEEAEKDKQRKVIEAKIS